MLCLRHIYDINPFCEVTPYPEGISEKNLLEFLVKPKVDILVEEMDDLVLKIKIRELAKKTQHTGNHGNWQRIRCCSGYRKIRLKF